MKSAPRTLGMAGWCLAILAGARPAAADPPIPLRYVYSAGGYTDTQRFVRPAGVFYDAVRDELYVADTGNGQIVVLDKRGLGVAKIRHNVIDPKNGNRHAGEPRSIAVRKNRDILVVDNLCSYVDVVDSTGHFIQKFWPGDLVGKARETIQPRCLAVDAAGNTYLAVSGNGKEILVLGPNLQLKTQFGVEATGDSRGVTGLWVDKEGRIFVTYGVGVCVRVFSPDGRQITSFGIHDSGPNNFSLPAGVITDRAGRLWALDTLRHVVAVFKPSPAGKSLTYTFSALTIGGMGGTAGELLYPTGIAGDGQTRLFVVESTGARVQAFQIEPGEAARAAG